MFEFIKMKKQTKKTTLLVALAIIMTVTMGTTLAYLMDKTDTFTNLFVPFFDHYGTLSIQKEVEHPYGDDYRIPEDLEFEFQVELGKDYAEKTVVVSKDGTKSEVMTDKDGMLTVTAKPGSTVNILEIAAGTKVTVTEIQKENDGFEAKEEVQSAEISRNEVAALNFVNVYKPEAVSPVNLEVNGTKILEGRDWKDGDAFSFLLEHQVLDEKTGEMVWEEVETAAVRYDATNKDFNKFDFNKAVEKYVFDECKTYAFRISEIPETSGGITYDNVVSYFDVTVGDADMDGYLEIQNVQAYQNAVAEFDEKTGAFVVSVEVKNVYAPIGNAKAVVNINKIYENHIGEELNPAGFVFELCDEKEQVQKVSTMSGAGETGFVLEFGKADIGKIFTYIIKERSDKEPIPGVQYDKTEYHLQIQVVDKLDGTIGLELSAKKIVNGESVDIETDKEKPHEITFTFKNIYDAKDAEVVIQGAKILSGRDMKAGEFAFHLYETASDFAVEETAKPIEIAKNNDKGEFSFGKLTFDEAGTYYYVVKEDVSSELGGIYYDDVCYHVTVHVTDENGVLSAKTTIRTIDGEDAELVFHNKYIPALAYVTLDGRKVLQGGVLAEDMFGFKLYAADETFTVDEEALQTVKNNEEGVFVFDSLSFTEAGTYYYIIEEDASNPIEDMTYDSGRYQVKVTVTDDGEGQLRAETVITRDGAAVEEIRFTNVWSGEGEIVVPGDPEEPKDPGSADTGDNANIFLYLAMLCACAAAIVGVIIFKKRK